MRRYIPLLLVGLCILFVILALLLYTTQIVGQKNQKEKFIPVTKTLTVYTTMPADMAMIIAQQYKQENNIQINFVQLNSEELQQKIADGSNAGEADLIVADSQLLEKIAQKYGNKFLQAFTLVGFCHTYDLDALGEIVSSEQLGAGSEVRSGWMW